MNAPLAMDDGAAAAVAAHLRYVTDRAPGIRRRRRGRSFQYRDARGRVLGNATDLNRIKSMAIPPAWREVWICTDARGHLQATGRDARGRKQYRYHPRWRHVRDAAKFDRLLEFAQALPALRRTTARDLQLTGLPRRKVLGTLVQLLERTLIRVGNREYAESNNSFGLTTLQDAHARISGSTVRFHFKGKSGKMHDIAFTDPRLARIVRRCQELPGRDLFQYQDDDGNVVDITSGDVNDYLREAMNGDFTAKDFRTWLGTVLAVKAFAEMPRFTSVAQATRHTNAVVEAVAGLLGNTRAVCRKCYIHPAVIEAYASESLYPRTARSSRRLGSLAEAEQLVVTLLRRLRQRTVRLSA